MHGHPVQGIKGAKAPKPENGKSRLSSRPGARIAELSEEYIELRNRAQQAKAEAAEIALAEKKGTLISLRLALRVVTRSLQNHARGAGGLGPRCVGLPDEHAAAQVLREMALALLADLQDLPARVTDPDWVEHIGDEEEGAPERRPTPEQAKAAAAKAKARREKRNTAQRRRRAEGRA